MTRRWTTIQNAIDTPFDNSTNGFISNEVQSAIEEARNSAVGKLMYQIFVANGNVSDKFLGWGNGSTTSDMVPLVLPFGGNLIGTTFTNTDDDVDTNVLVYKNGVTPGDLMFTREIRNKRTAYKTDFIVSGFSQGDRVSVFLEKETGGTGDNTAQDPQVLLIFAINPAELDEGGQRYGD